eukprot:503468_1
MNRLNKLLKQLDQHNDCCVAHKYTNNVTDTSITHTFYKYTVDNNILTPSQRDFYEQNGYIIIRNLLHENNCDILKKRFNELITNPSERNCEVTVMKDIGYKILDKINNTNTLKNKSIPSEINKLQNLGFDPIYNKYFETNKDIINYTKAFVGDNLRTLDHIHLQKPPDLGFLSSRHPLHQDAWYYGFTNIDRVVGVWTALEKVNRNNGGLCVVPGTHKDNILYKHIYPTGSFNRQNTNLAYFGVDTAVYDKVKRRRIHLDMNKGDTVYFHPLLIHGSSANLSNTCTRHAYITHYANSKVVGFDNYLDKNINKHNVENMKNEIATLGNRNTRFNRNMLWKVVSRQITGNVGQWNLTDKEIKFVEKKYFKRKMDAKNWTNQ